MKKYDIKIPKIFATKEQKSFTDAANKELESTVNSYESKKSNLRNLGGACLAYSEQFTGELKESAGKEAKILLGHHRDIPQEIETAKQTENIEIEDKINKKEKEPEIVVGNGLDHSDKGLDR